MQQISDIAALRQQIKAWRQSHQTIAFVPTMGNLHQGHLSLIEQAAELADKVVVSIFVNPLQFNDKADLSAYPRTLDSDLAKLKASACDVVFTPTVAEMYPQGDMAQTIVSVPNMDNRLCGKDRPGHFDGVATVVNKLFNIVQADFAVFGEKDYQQVLVIKQMVADLSLNIKIVSAPIYREDSGLAMSSRNQYLTADERRKAAELYQALLAIKDKIQQGERDFASLEQHAFQHLQQQGFKPDYVAIEQYQGVSQLDLAEKTDLNQQIKLADPLILLVAAQLSKARLIDNIVCDLD